ncbi:hypothetical protein J2785_002495 [Burkholderia ambifaria]|nr:hypothetical protein [Burkholderia ambifaria]MDR6499342.1 hypothetical protein [Burkholderia ambifaria]
MLENRLQRGAGVASARRYPHPKIAPRRVRVPRDTTAAGHATLQHERLPVQRSGAVQRARQCGLQRIVPLRQPTVQTVGDHACRSISIGRAHVAAGPRAGSRLK